MLNKKNTSWGKVAGWYDNLLEAGDDTYQEKVILPNLLRIVNARKGEKIIDIGCGQGYFSRALAAGGAEVLGVDVAGELIRLAAARAGKNESYLVLSAEKLSGIADARFDAAVCVLALQNMKNFSAAVAEMARVVKPSGRIVLVLNHPAFRVPAASAWEFDENKKIQYRRVERYLSEITQAVDMTQGVKNPRQKKFTYSFHHPLQVYFKVFYKCGLAAVRLEEWVSHKVSDKGARKAAEDKARKEFPLFMCLELRKSLIYR